jgi:hypothetical protein
MEHLLVPVGAQAVGAQAVGTREAEIQAARQNMARLLGVPVGA